MQALKIILIGDTGVGKSQLSRCLMNKDFMEDAQSTVGMEFQSKKFEFEKCVVTSQIWDTAGQERFAGMTRAYYRDAVAAILVYDVCNKDSLIRLETVWLPQLREFGHRAIKLVLVGNKADVAINDPSKRDVTIEEGIAFAERQNVDFLEASAFTKLNVERMFRRVSLSVAKLLPDVKQHLELLNLPDGWLAIMPPQLIRAASDSSAELNVGNSGGVSGSPSTSLEPPFPRPPMKTSSFNITDSPESFKPIGIDGASVINRRRSLKRDNSSPTSKVSHAPKVRYSNYWTGEEVDELPTEPADPGLLYTHVPQRVERASSISAALDKKVLEEAGRESIEGRPAPTERSSSVTISGDNFSSSKARRSDNKVKRCCTIS